MASDSTCFSGNADDISSLLLALATSGTGVWDRDIRSGRIVYSAAWKAILGYREDEIGDRIEESYTRVHPDDLAGVRAKIQSHFDGQTPTYEVEHRLRCKDGHYKWVLSRGKVVERDPDGTPLRMTGTTTDISDTVALSEQLRRSAELLTHLTDEVPGLVYQYCLRPDGHASFPYASAGMRAIFGTNPALAAIDAVHAESAIHPDDIEAYRNSLAQSAHTLGRWHMEFRVQLPGEGLRWHEAQARPCRLENGSTVWHGFIADITAHKELEQRLVDAAATDFLTGLPNRRAIMARMEQELARVQRDPHILSAVLMFDLDYFKNINDHYGHPTGDEVLKHFAGVLQLELRKVDSVGRIGGEEFVILLCGADLEDATRFAERVRQRLHSDPMPFGDTCLPVTVSIGVAAMLSEDHCADNALSRADAALYRAKQRGRNRVEVA
ncbi:sensor domain-containing diguanylate cyclase [Massilia sp. CF038]|uniref:sensor domain-containing diguanylate cyclase n=2 Tax=Pseudomonadota TaxID=1224 RepID=UPI0009194A98|nr:sensor domain-containing diguanylate cyclase [Massilia sp. CF038]SHH23110.1 PAS domain S-box-containing protein/diguanylate cyclase (GGDEF) domain-containing protein [Massilia sp. CF038]